MEDIDNYLLCWLYILIIVFHPYFISSSVGY